METIENKRLEMLLQNWVDCFASGVGGIQCANMWNLINKGGVSVDPGRPASMNVNEEAYMIEDLVNAMAKTHYKWAQALRDRYFAKDNDYPMSNGKRRDVVSKLARKRGISCRMFHVRIKNAKEWLLERIDLFHHQKKHKLAA